MLSPHSLSHCGTGSGTATTKKKTQLWEAEETRSWSGAWMAWWWPLLALIQTLHQKQPRSLMVASPPQLIPQYTLKVHMCPTCFGCGSTAAPDGKGWSQGLTMRDKGDLCFRLCLSRSREITAGVCTGSASERLCLQPTACLGPTCFSTPLLWGRVQV